MSDKALTFEEMAEISTELAVLRPDTCSIYRPPQVTDGIGGINPEDFELVATVDCRKEGIDTVLNYNPAEGWPSGESMPTALFVHLETEVLPADHVVWISQNAAVQETYDVTAVGGSSFVFEKKLFCVMVNP